MDKTDISIDPYENVIKFLIHEKFLTIAVLGSVITFQFVSTFKTSIIDPLLDFVLPADKFNFMNIVLREADTSVLQRMELSLGIGTFFKEFIKWMIGLVLIFLLAKYSKFPRLYGKEAGNYSGAAIM